MPIAPIDLNSVAADEVDRKRVHTVRDGARIEQSLPRHFLDTLSTWTLQAQRTRAGYMLWWLSLQMIFTSSLLALVITRGVGVNFDISFPIPCRLLFPIEGVLE